MPQLDISTYTSQLFWLGICFFILMAFTLCYSVPRLKKVLRARWEQSEGFRLEATRTAEEAQSIQVISETELNAARKRARTLMREARQMVESDSQERRSTIQEDIKRQMLDAEAQMQATFNQNLHELEKSMNRYVKLCVDKIVTN